MLTLFWWCNIFEAFFRSRRTRAKLGCFSTSKLYGRISGRSRGCVLGITVIKMRKLDKRDEEDGDDGPQEGVIMRGNEEKALMLIKCAMMKME